jgi:protein-tyrosine phosphatase
MWLAQRARSQALHILFVCTGNICRSPTAERLAAAYGADLGIPDFLASSAGTQALIGYPMHEEAARVLSNLGGDPSGFTARQLTARTTAGVDLVLTMAREHRDAVLELAPRLLHRTFTLAEAARLISEFGARDVAGLSSLRPHMRQDDSADIPDPIGRDPEFFDRTGALIADFLRPIMGVCRQAPADAGP